jgi:hypothetical protein
MFHSTEPQPRQWFEEWREPGEFYQAAYLGLHKFCTDTTPGHYLREAYLIGWFGSIWRDNRGPCEVRLLTEGGFPDAELRADGVHLNLEVTMARPKDKPMFKELRELRAKMERGEVVLAEPPEKCQASAREAIPRVVGKKANKHYAGAASATLLGSTSTALSAEELARLTQPWKDCFDAIYLICGLDVVMAWPSLSILRGQWPLWRPGVTAGSPRQEIDTSEQSPD